VRINGNTLSDIEGDGIFLSNRAGSNGTLSQNITINDNTLSFIDDYGIKVRSTASGGGASLSQVLQIDPNTINHTGSSAIYVSTTSTRARRHADGVDHRKLHLRRGRCRLGQRHQGEGQSA